MSVGAARFATAAALAGLAGLHVAWGAGSAFPTSGRPELADLVAGSDEMPGPVECVAVAGLPGSAATIVVGPRWLPERLRRIAARGVAGELRVRALLGATGRTGSVVPWTPSERFRRVDRAVYAPLCALLACGAALTVRRD